MENQDKKQTKNPGIAAVLSFIIPGLGQIYCERIGRGIVWLIFAILGYFAFVIPGIIVAVLATFDALKLARAINEGKTDYGIFQGKQTDNADVSIEAVDDDWQKNKWWYLSLVALFVLIVLGTIFASYLRPKSGTNLQQDLKQDAASAQRNKYAPADIKEYAQLLEEIKMIDTIKSLLTERVDYTGMDEAEKLVTAISGYEEQKNKFIELRDTLEKITPPDVVSEEHKGYISAMENYIKASDITLQYFTTSFGQQDKIDEGTRYYAAARKLVESSTDGVNRKLGY